MKHDAFGESPTGNCRKPKGYLILDANDGSTHMPGHGGFPLCFGVQPGTCKDTTPFLRSFVCITTSFLP